MPSKKPEEKANRDECQRTLEALSSSKIPFAMLLSSGSILVRSA